MRLRWRQNEDASTLGSTFPATISISFCIVVWVEQGPMFLIIKLLSYTCSDSFFASRWPAWSPSSYSLRVPNNRVFLMVRSLLIAKRAKSKNKMQITEFPERLSRHKLVLREIQGI